MVLPEGDIWTWWLSQHGVPHHKLAELGPDFLVISPPKTGSTWLAANLQNHRQIFVPAVKEVKYFSSFFKSLDLNWYLEQFLPAGGRLKGEASPSYALLPLDRIKLLHRLLPRVKLIFLMRDPIARAWSHAKHNYRYREANFASCTADFPDIGDGEWRANFIHDWTLASGDYLGHLQRWLAVFPREQMFLGFFESIANAPETLLRDLFRFLGVDPNVNLAGFPWKEQVLAGLPGGLPTTLAQSLHALLHHRSLELAAFLREDCNLTPPTAWQTILQPRADPSSPTTPVQDLAARFRALDDNELSRILALEESFPSARCPVIDDYRGYDIGFAHGCMYAVSKTAGYDRPTDLDEGERQRLQSEGALFLASSLTAVRNQVDQHVFKRTQVKLGELESLQGELREARNHIASLERRLAEAGHAIVYLEAEVKRQRPWYQALARYFRRRSG